MSYLKKALIGVGAAIVCIGAADMLGPKLPAALSVAGKDARPYVAGGVTLAIASVVAHKLGVI
jgi:hypothetical protein